MHRVALLLVALILITAACSSADGDDVVTGASAPGSAPTPTEPLPTTPGTSVSATTTSLEPSQPTTVAPPPTITTLVTFGGEEPPVVISQPVGCDATPGSPIDLDAEPVEWLAFGRYTRWFDAAGCPVRVGVISHTNGAAHCGWETAEFISIGRPFGESINSQPRAETVNRYVWDPERVLPGGPIPDSVAVEDMADTVSDTGYRQGVRSLWLDSADEAVLYVVYQGRADIWVRNSGLGICA